MYGLPYYERGIRAMHSEVAPYIRMKEKKEKTLQQMISTGENSQQRVPKHSPFKRKFKDVYSSFVH